VAYRGQLPDALLDSLSVDQRTRWWGEGWWGEDLARRGLLVAETDDAILGFVAAGPSRDDHATQATGEVYAIYAEPDEWGHGIGRHLMERALDELRSAGFTQATLWVVESNQRARDFYEMGGWHADGSRRTEQLQGGGAEAMELRYRCSL
jgi:GNAT superfamily N-acetyltransferase